MNRNSVDTVERWTKMPKADDLRGFVAEKLAAASREILAAVDRLVAGYEEEASGFRQEINRQRRQLDALRQPQVAVIDPGTKCNQSLSHDEEEEDPAALDNLEDLNNQTPSSSQFGRRKPVRPRISNTQDCVHLKFCVLEDSHSQLLPKQVLKKCPVVKLKCPCGLREPEFLGLLRSTFPQLEGDNRQFDILTSNKTRRLQRLRLKTVTPEEIQHVCCTDLEESTLFIRLKTQEEPESKEKENPPLQTHNIRTKGFLSTLTCDDNRPHTSGLVQADGSSAATQNSSSAAQPQLVETGPADGEEVNAEPAEDAGSKSTAEPQASLDEGERQQARESQSKKVKNLKGRQSFVKVTETTTTENSNDFLSCKVCGELQQLDGSFVQHAWTHADEFVSACGLCGAVSESVEALKDHLQNSHKTEDCHKCGESFLSVLSLSKRVAAHSEERPYECEVCKGAFALNTSQESQQKLQEASKTHKCHKCHKVFELKEQLDAHYWTHAAKKAHVCGVCGKSLSDYRSLSRHKFTHTGERPHSCQVCGRRFKLIGALRQHEKTHADRERSYLCDVCCKMFLTSKQLQIHMRTHTNEKPYHCSECGKGFTTRGPLTVHMRVHTGETPYRCPDCGWSFKRKSNLDDHLTVHSGIKAFVCGICGKACARKTHLTVHMRTHNGERPYKCSMCGKAFTQSHCLKTHAKSHQKAEAAL